MCTGDPGLGECFISYLWCLQGFFFFPSSIPHTGMHRTACKWPLSRCHLNLSRYRTGKYLCFVCFGRFTVSPSLLSLLSESNMKLPNDQHFVFRGRKTTCGRKQTSNEIPKLLYRRAQHLTLRDWKQKDTFHSHLQVCFLYPPLGPPPAPAATTDRAQKCLYLQEAWQLSDFLLVLHIFLKGSKDVWVLILMLSPAPLSWLLQFLCLRRFTSFPHSLAPWAAASVASCAQPGELGAAPQLPAEPSTTPPMQNNMLRLDLAPRRRSVRSHSALVSGCAWPGAWDRQWLTLLFPIAVRSAWREV